MVSVPTTQANASIFGVKSSVWLNPNAPEGGKGGGGRGWGCAWSCTTSSTTSTSTSSSNTPRPLSYNPSCPHPTSMKNFTCPSGGTSLSLLLHPTSTTGTGIGKCWVKGRRWGGGTLRVRKRIVLLVVGGEGVLLLLLLLVVVVVVCCVGGGVRIGGGRGGSGRGGPSLTPSPSSSYLCP